MEIKPAKKTLQSKLKSYKDGLGFEGLKSS